MPEPLPNPADPPAAPRLLLTNREAAAALSVSERTLWGLTSPRGPIPTVRLGRAVRYSLVALQEFIQAAQERGQQ
jgi:hypothetical protein